MKTVYILRHAKSSWDFPHLSDEERPLIDKGKKRTRLINEYLINNQISIDLILSSHAVRAFDTAKIIARAIGYPLDKIRINKMIYHSHEENLIDQFYDLSDEISSVMLVGHNPTLTNFVNLFLDEKIEWLPTSGLVSINFYTDQWVNLSTAKFDTNFVITPSMLKKKD
ncbi:MAG: histidine phosphatase family protein [Bacteroidales bacterium]|nr:histidine phosphatase family protein [Bacteroidales bacterium]